MLTEMRFIVLTWIWDTRRKVTVFVIWIWANDHFWFHFNRVKWSLLIPLHSNQMITFDTTCLVTDDHHWFHFNREKWPLSFPTESEQMTSIVFNWHETNDHYWFHFNRDKWSLFFSLEFGCLSPNFLFLFLLDREIALHLLQPDYSHTRITRCLVFR